MKAIRWSGDGDRYFGPFTYCGSDYNRLAFVLGSGDGEDYKGCRLRIHLFRKTFIVALPSIIKPYREWIDTSMYNWGENMSGGYFDQHEREYGISYSDGFFQLFFGQQTHDSRTTRGWSGFLPWTQWRHVRHSYYDKSGLHFWTEPEGIDWDKRHYMRSTVPAVAFEFEDYDGKRIKAATRIDEREWHFGTGWFKWLSLFCKPKIRRSLDLTFSEEVGPEKGSWKGGTLGHGIDMLPGELHESAFKRYCAQEHRSKYRNFNIKFIDRVAECVKKQALVPAHFVKGSGMAEIIKRKFGYKFNVYTDRYEPWFRWPLLNVAHKILYRTDDQYREVYNFSQELRKLIKACERIKNGQS